MRRRRRGAKERPMGERWTAGETMATTEEIVESHTVFPKPAAAAFDIAWLCAAPSPLPTAAHCT
jgi:hypothetical protein